VSTPDPNSPTNPPVPSPEPVATTDLPPPSSAADPNATRTHFAESRESIGPTDDPRLGSVFPVIPGYLIEGELGRGGMGVVYRARQADLHRPVAIKMILGGKYTDSVAQARFLVEAEVIAAIQSPHIVQVHEFGRHDDQPYFVLEFVGGGSLAGKLKAAGRFSPRDAAVMVAKLAEGMAAAHQKGVVHRDLKPANVLLTESGEPKVTDFGLAKVGQSDITATGAVMGTPSYMSPEQAAGRTKEVGTPTDVYALGAILYELLTGRPPFVGDSAMATIQQVLTREPEGPRAIEAKVPRDLETICLKCLQKDAPKRYATAVELASELRAFLDGRPIVARPVGLPERTWKWVRRNPGRAAAVAAGILVLVAAAVATNEVRKQQAADRLAAELHTREKQRQTRAESLVQALAVADTAAVPRVVEDLVEVRDLARPNLFELAAQPVTTKPGLHARLAVLVEEPPRAAELAAYLPACNPEELLTIRQFLTPHAVAVAADLWAILTDAKAEAGKRVRAGCALAGLTPHDARWNAVAPGIADAVVRANPADFVVWAKAMAPVRVSLLPALVKRYPESRTRLASGRLAVSDLAAEATAFDLTADLLARYAFDRPAELAELSTTVDARHYPRFADALRRNAAAVVPVLKAELAGQVPPRGTPAGGAPVAAAVTGVPMVADGLEPDPVLDALARRRGYAAAELVRLGEAKAVWHLFRFPADGDPGARSYLLARLAAVGADPFTLVRRFEADPDVSAKRALLIALGDFPAGGVLATEGAFVARLLGLYREHPDSGLHGAIDWLLRQQWGKERELAAIDAELTRTATATVKSGHDPARTAKDWFVNGEGQTYAVIRGPVEFTMGSPTTEPGRIEANEPLVQQRIVRSFALATKEVTVEQFLRFRPQHNWEKRYSPGPDTPAVSVTWYDSAAYCNWLSEREGIPREQWCYEPNAAGAYAVGMRVKPGLVRLTGYRLPTEAEWEYSCRSGAVTARHYGRGEELLARYGWSVSVSANRAWPVGRLRPNDRGLFDILGNAFEWAGDPAQQTATGQPEPRENSKPTPVDERNICFLRGATFFNLAVYLRCAFRNYDVPGYSDFSIGLRPARTLPPIP
jgi:formylglycine-generating enzyme required for sulfatase activity/tRNA A-37 threonylcarbamoyl transferase component Bud32